MKKYLEMLIFVFILGIVASGILEGMDLLTRDRIKANQTVELRSTILDSFDIPYKPSDINQIFDEKVEVIQLDNLVTIYLSPDKLVGYEFIGSGLWGPISGFVALNEELDTIVNLVVLEQEETPGLGGVVASKGYLETFKGVKMIPSLEINKDTNENKENEVDTITGATRTSKAFEIILNNAYKDVSDLYLNR